MFNSIVTMIVSCLLSGLISMYLNRRNNLRESNLKKSNVFKNMYSALFNSLNICKNAKKVMENVDLDKEDAPKIRQAMGDYSKELNSEIINLSVLGNTNRQLINNKIYIDLVREVDELMDYCKQYEEISLGKSNKIIFNKENNPFLDLLDYFKHEKDRYEK